MQDVFKVIYSPDEPTGGKSASGLGEDMKGKAAVQGPQTQEQAENSRSLNNVLNFINSEFFAFDKLSLYRPSHFKVGPQVVRNKRNSLLMLSSRSGTATD